MNFLFDNNMPQPLARALLVMGKTVSHVRDFPSELGLKPSDPQIMEFAAPRGFCVVTRDLAQADEPWFKPSLLRLGVGYYFYRSSHSRGVEPPAWDICKLIVRSWDDIERYRRENKMPFCALIKSNGRVTGY